MSDSEFGLEDWQKPFIRQFARDAERRDGNLPDAGDYDLYDGYEGDDEEDAA